MEIYIEKARPEDYEEVIDFGNYVFSRSRGYMRALMNRALDDMKRDLPLPLFFEKADEI